MLNRVEIIGNLGADPEIKSFSNGGKIANLRVAVTEKWKDKQSGEQRERTEWVPVTINSDGLVSVAERFLRKGSKVYVAGQFRTRKWQDQSGNDRFSTEVVLSGFDAKLLLLGDGQGGTGRGQRNGREQQSQSFNDGFDSDEVPF